MNDLIEKKVGLLENLSTEEKNNMVAAVNEINDLLGELVNTVNQNNQSFQQGLDTKTNKSDYKLYAPYKGDDVAVDLDNLENGASLFAGSVPVLHAPNDTDTVGDAVLYQPKKNFGWQMLGATTGLHYRKFYWDGNAMDWEQIAFASMLFNGNLLINSDFQINQRGQSSYQVTNRYSVDRWMGWNTIITPNKDGINIGIANTGYWEFRQYLEYKKKDLLGKYLTMSICVDGVVYSRTFEQIPDLIETEWANSVNVNGALYTRITIREDVLIFWIYNNGTQSYQIDWVKLEFGKIATPFIPPNPVIELIKCQKYYKRIYLYSLNATQYYTQANKVYFRFHFEKMRTETPTVSFVGTNAVDNVNTNNHFAVIEKGNAILGWSVSKDVQYEIALRNYENADMIAILPSNIAVTNKDFTLMFGKGAGIEVDAEIYV